MKSNERPWADHGNDSEAEIFTAVGRALSCWEMLESSVACLFTTITVGNYYAPTTPVLQAYSAITGSSNRIRVVQAALESWRLSWPDCPVGQNVSELLKVCDSWAGRRNDIAHGLVDMNVDDSRWYLFPSLYTRKGRTLIPNPVQGKPVLHKSDYRYNADIIDAFSDEFTALFNQMNQVISALGEWYRIRSGQGP